MEVYEYSICVFFPIRSSEFFRKKKLSIGTWPKIVWDGAGDIFCFLTNRFESTTWTRGVRKIMKRDTKIRLLFFGVFLIMCEFSLICLLNRKNFFIIVRLLEQWNYPWKRSGKFCLFILFSFSFSLRMWGEDGFEKKFASIRNNSILRDVTKIWGNNCIENMNQSFWMVKMIKSY